MSHPWHHAQSSARKYSGVPEDYVAIHSWFDASKAHYADFRHRALRHHAMGIFEAEEKFGVTITNSAGKIVPVRFIGEQHVKEDCGGVIPSVKDWLRGVEGKPWMHVGKLSGDEVLVKDDGQLDLSVEAWRKAVAQNETCLGHKDWADRVSACIVKSYGNDNG